MRLLEVLLRSAFFLTMVWILMLLMGYVHLEVWEGIPALGYVQVMWGMLLVTAGTMAVQFLTSNIEK